MMKTKIHSLSAAVLAVASVGYAGVANAALLSCPTGFTADDTAKVYYDGTSQLTAAGDCRYISPADQSNVASLANVNSAGFFGTTTWLSNSQTQVVGADYTGLSGSWSISAVDFTMYDYIIVFKDGNDTNLVAFLLNEKASSGNWITPFTNPPFSVGDNGRDVSHVSVFKRTGIIVPPDEEPVPEPGVLFLIGAGLLGLGMARRRKSA